jgi:hypothetical protein
MRAFQSSLVLVAALTLIGCAHPVTPVQSTQAPAADMRVSDVPDEQRAKEIISQKFTEVGTQIAGITLEKTDIAKVYTFICLYRRAEFGQLCLYEAKGQVDIQSGKLVAKRKLTLCFGAEKS